MSSAKEKALEVLGRVECHASIRERSELRGRLHFDDIARILDALEAVGLLRETAPASSSR